MATPLLPITDYPTLLTAAARMIDRTDMGDFLPVCVGFATARFNLDLRVRDMQRRSVATVIVPAQYVDLPDDFLEMASVTPVTSGPAPPLESFTIDQFRRAQYERSPSEPALTVPNYFTVWGTQILLGPDAIGLGAGTYPLEIMYYAQIATLTPANPTNWLLTKHPDLYLYQTLVATAPYLRDDERIGVWQSLATQLMAGVQMASDRTELVGGRMRPRSNPLA